MYINVDKIKMECFLISVIDSPGGLEFQRSAHMPDWVSSCF